MAFTSGTATDYHDLLDKLRLYLVAQGWTQLAWTPPVLLTDQATLYIRGPGAGADKQVFLQFQTANDPASNSYAWKLRGAVGYDAALSWSGQPGVSGDSYYTLWPNAIDYWFYVNDRRVIVVAKIGVIYISMYAGFFLPFALPDEYPFPLYIAGNIYTLVPYNNASSSNRFFVDPGADGQAVYRRRITGTWAALRNHGGGENLDNVFNENSVHMWPHRTGRADGQDFNDNWEYYWLMNLRPNLNGEMPMFQPHIIDSYANVIPGGLDGVYVTGGFNRVPEQTIAFGGRTFRLFPNIFRSRPKDFMAIEEL